MTQLCIICLRALCKKLNTVSVLYIAVKHLLKDLNTLQQEKKNYQITSIKNL